MELANALVMLFVPTLKEATHAHVLKDLLETEYLVSTTTNARTVQTTAILMQLVRTHQDLSHVHATQDMLEMELSVQM